jgi:putative DNA primase/helicase
MQHETISTTFSDDLTDTGNAKRFAISAQDKLLYEASAGHWLLWDGARWTTKNAASFATVLAQENSLALEIAPNTADSESYRSRLNWAKVSRSLSKINATLTLASKEPDLRVPLMNFDQAKDTIYLQNGALDLRRLAFTPATPSQRNLKLANAVWSIEAVAPKFSNFIEQICCGDRELVNYLRVLIGYAATGYTSEQALFVFLGDGANGKSTLLNIVASVLGDYASSFDFSHLLHSDKTNVRSLEMLASLDRVRLAYASEVPQDRRLNEALVKKITGSDMIYASRLHSSSYEFSPQFTPFLLTNHLPRIKDLGFGMRRRLKIVPFNATFSGNSQDLSLERYVLEHERAGVIRWIAEGANEWLKTESSLGSRLPLSIAVERATVGYFREQATLFRFLKETGKLHAGFRIGASELLLEYLSFLQAIGCYEQVTPKSLSTQMISYGFSSKRISSGVVYVLERLPEALDELLVEAV